MKKWKIKITPEQLIDFLKWEQDHQLKLFPWMEGEGDGNALQNHGKLREEGRPGDSRSGGRGADPDENF